MATNTPWGLSQQVTKVSVGIRDYQTAGHGGFHLSPRKNAQIPEYMRSDDGWYEEDCAWSIPAMIFQDEFMGYFKFDVTERIIATFKQWYPSYYERFYGVTLKEGESSTRDHDVFLDNHKDDYLVTSAVQDNDMVRCTAVIGGCPSNNKMSKTFLVSKNEYATRKFSFVIDPSRHEEVKTS